MVNRFPFHQMTHSLIDACCFIAPDVCNSSFDRSNNVIGENINQRRQRKRHFDAISHAVMQVNLLSSAETPSGTFRETFIPI